MQGAIKIVVNDVPLTEWQAVAVLFAIAQVVDHHEVSNDPEDEVVRSYCARLVEVLEILKDAEPPLRSER